MYKLQKEINPTNFNRLRERLHFLLETARAVPFRLSTAQRTPSREKTPTGLAEEALAAELAEWRESQFVQLGGTSVRPLKPAAFIGAPRREGWGFRIHMRPIHASTCHQGRGVGGPAPPSRASPITALWGLLCAFVLSKPNLMSKITSADLEKEKKIKFQPNHLTSEYWRGCLMLEGGSSLKQGCWFSLPQHE